VYGESSADDYAGVIGVGLTELTQGVYGLNPFGGIAVRGMSLFGGIGIQGIANSPGLAGEFQGDVNITGNVNISGNVGIGTDSSANRLHVVSDYLYSAIYAEYRDTVHTGAAAITGSSTTSDGILGFSESRYGVVGTSLSGVGVFGTSVDGYAGRFSGDVRVDGNLTVYENISWNTKKSYISVPAAAFNPTEDGYDYENIGYKLSNKNGPSDLYLAAIQLPHGSKITNMTFVWKDSDSSVNGIVTLWQQSGFGSIGIAQVHTSGDSPYPGSSYDNSIDKIIDNSKYGYYLQMYLPSTDIDGSIVIIEYEINEPY
jgi:hypothetical protein